MYIKACCYSIKIEFSGKNCQKENSFPALVTMVSQKETTVSKTSINYNDEPVKEGH